MQRMKGGTTWEGRRRTLPSLPPSLQLLLEEEHKETLTIIATVIFGLV
jgi:hypothetical protein